jgi:hypothetical protein
MMGMKPTENAGDAGENAGEAGEKAGEAGENAGDAGLWTEHQLHVPRTGSTQTRTRKPGIQAE